MALGNDRVKGVFAALFKATVRRLDYLALYRGKVVQQAKGTNTLDVLPDDKRLPSMARVPMRHGVPGLTVTVPDGSSVLIGWENGDPSKPYCCLWEGAEATIQLTLNAGKIYLAGKPVEEGGDLITGMDGFVHGRANDSFTGAPYFALGATSSKVMGAK